MHFAGCVLPPARTGLQPVLSLQTVPEGNSLYSCSLQAREGRQKLGAAKPMRDPLPSSPGHQEACHLPFGVSQCKEENEAEDGRGEDV